MDKQANNRSADESRAAAAFAKALRECGPALEQCCREAGIERWGIPAETFTNELELCARKRFKNEGPSADELLGYLGTLHLKDLALACACANGVTEAWEYFIATYRGYLRACAAVMLKRSANAPEAEELADSLFAELYGLSLEKRGSLMRYFQGRSTLKTWLRAVMAQRHVDKIRAGRKFTELGDEDGSDGEALRGSTTPPVLVTSDPHRERYLRLFTSALQTALKNLDAQSAERLRMYYADEKKLAEIGRALGEHESSVSRHLEKARKELRGAVEEILRIGAGPVNGEMKTGGLSDAEIALCFEYAAEDAPIDLDKLFPTGGEQGPERGGKEL
jgi:RNA polymerase sigma factor (sigma-70 family)